MVDTSQYYYAITFISSISLKFSVGILFDFWPVAFCCRKGFIMFNKRIPYFCHELYAKYDPAYFICLKILLNYKNIYKCLILLTFVLSDLIEIVNSLKQTISTCLPVFC